MAEPEEHKQRQQSCVDLCSSFVTHNLYNMLARPALSTLSKVSKNCQQTFAHFTVHAVDLATDGELSQQLFNKFVTALPERIRFATIVWSPQCVYDNGICVDALLRRTHRLDIYPHTGLLQLDVPRFLNMETKLFHVGKKKGWKHFFRSTPDPVRTVVVTNTKAKYVPEETLKLICAPCGRKVTQYPRQCTDVTTLTLAGDVNPGIIMALPPTVHTLRIGTLCGGYDYAALVKHLIRLPMLSTLYLLLGGCYSTACVAAGLRQLAGAGEHFTALETFTITVLPEGERLGSLEIPDMESVVPPGCVLQLTFEPQVPVM